MSTNPGLHDRLQVVQGDITTLAVDAIVTAANESLTGGGGVDGAVHRAAGPALFDECRTLGICNEGEAKLTRGYLLPARFIIHTVGPVWEGGGYDEAGTLRRCYDACFQLAANRGFQTLAFPCIATGTYEFPHDLACEIAFEAAASWLVAHDRPQIVTFCCFEDLDAELYRKRLSTVARQ